MPIHDWNRVDANLFHHFHQAWTMTICNAWASCPEDMRDFVQRAEEQA